MNEDNALKHLLDPYALTTGNLRRTATCVFLACEESVAQDISKKLRWAADEIENLMEQLANAPAVTSTERKCQKCGSPTTGEEAYVDGQIWCHPCADEAAFPSTDNSGAK